MARSPKELDASSISEFPEFLITKNTIVIGSEFFPLTKVTGFGRGDVAVAQKPGCIPGLLGQKEVLVAKPALIIYFESGDSRALINKSENITKILVKLHEMYEKDEIGRGNVQFNISNSHIGAVGDGAVASFLSK